MLRAYFTPNCTAGECDHAGAVPCAVQFPAILRAGGVPIQIYQGGLIVGRGRHEFCEQCGSINFYGVWMPPASEVVIGQKTPIDALRRYRDFRARSVSANAPSGDERSAESAGLRA